MAVPIAGGSSQLHIRRKDGTVASADERSTGRHHRLGRVSSFDRFAGFVFLFSPSAHCKDSITFFPSGIVGFVLRYITPLTIAPSITMVGVSLFSSAGDLVGKHWGVAAG